MFYILLKIVGLLIICKTQSFSALCKIGVFFLKKKSRFTSCKAEQPLQGMELQEKEAQKD